MKTIKLPRKTKRRFNEEVKFSIQNISRNLFLKRCQFANEQPRFFSSRETKGRCVDKMYDNCYYKTPLTIGQV